MADVMDMIENLNSLNIDKEAKVAIAKTTNDMVKLNQEQLTYGLRADGKKIGHYRNSEYAAMKNAMNPLPGFGFVDLILTGAFYESFEIDVNGDELERFATDSKADSLIDKYGDEVFGLTENNQEFYNEEIFYPLFTDSIEEQTGLKFE